MNLPATKMRGRPRSFDRDTALEQAMLLFWRQGYAATSISELTAVMGINPPSLYAAFGDKEHLFLEAVARYQCGAGDFDERVTGALTARAAIERILRSTAEHLTAPDRPPGCMVVTATMNCTSECSHLQRALAEMRSTRTRRVEERLSEAVSNGELPKDTDPAALASFYITVMQGMTIQARDGATRDQLLGTAEAAMRAWPA